MASSQAQCPAMPTPVATEEAETSVLSSSSNCRRRDKRHICETAGRPAPLSEHVPVVRQCERMARATGTTTTGSTTSRLAELKEQERVLYQCELLLELREDGYAKWEKLNRSAEAAQIPSFPEWAICSSSANNGQVHFASGMGCEGTGSVSTGVRVMQPVAVSSIGVGGTPAVSLPSTPQASTIGDLY